MEDTGNVSYPSQYSDAEKAVISLTKLLLEAGNLLTTLRREFRGEAVYQGSDGQNYWIQISKPVFIKLDKDNEPLKQEVDFPDGTKREVYVPNEEAIEEVLSMMKFAGLNQVTPITKVDKNNILDDLKEFECKLASVLALKQRDWGMDKELLPMIQYKIKTVVQDARFMAENGNILQALKTSVQRIEQVHEGAAPRVKSPYQ